MSRAAHDTEAEIAALADLGREELAQRWMKGHGSLPPKGLRHELLVRSAAWHAQAKRFGGLSPATRRALKAAMADVGQSRISQQTGQARASKDGCSKADKAAGGPRKQPAPGARLVRDWNGKRHVVDVIEAGFVFEAKTYRSLTAIARQITGAHWSGPRFFGL